MSLSDILRSIALGYAVDHSEVRRSIGLTLLAATDHRSRSNVEEEQRMKAEVMVAPGGN